MHDERFWDSIIGANPLETSGDVDIALRDVRIRLASTSAEVASEFDRWLSGRIYQLDRRALFELPVPNGDGIETGQSEDHFLYARCACVLAGRVPFLEVLSGARSFADFSRIPLQKAELLLYIPEEVCREEFDTQIARFDSWPLEAGSNHEYWLCILMRSEYSRKQVP
jgi:hypothetical protein